MGQIAISRDVPEPHVQGSGACWQRLDLAGLAPMNRFTRSLEEGQVNTEEHALCFSKIDIVGDADRCGLAMD
jgi:hypothetical protein